MAIMAIAVDGVKNEDVNVGGEISWERLSWLMKGKARERTRLEVNVTRAGMNECGFESEGERQEVAREL